MDKLTLAVKKFYKWAQTVSTQRGDIYKAIVDSKVLGHNGETWDVNSKAADIIFGLMEKHGYSGKLVISVVYTAKGAVDLLVVSGNSKLSAAVKQAFLGAVTKVVKSLPAPMEDVKVPDVVTAQNA